MGKNKNLEPGSYAEIKSSLRGTELVKIVGYRGEIMECLTDTGALTMVKPNSNKVVRIFQVDDKSN